MEGWGQRRVVGWQGLLGLAAVLVVIVQLVDVERPDLWIARAVLGTAYVGCAAMLQTRWGRHRAEQVLVVACFFTGFTVLGVNATSPISADAALLLLVTTATVGLVLPSVWDRSAYVSMMLLGTAATVWLVPPAGVGAGLLLAALGSVAGVAVVHGYQADRKTTELEELSLVASRVHNGVALLDTRGRIEWVNAAFIKLAGERGPDLQGRRLLELLQGPEAPPDGLERLGEAIRNGHQASVELPHRSALGAITWVSVDLTPVRDPLGSVKRFIAVETDISRARAFLARILDSMTDVLLVVQEGRGIRSANEAACRLLELAEGELIGRPLEQFFDDDGATGPAAEGASRLRMLLSRRMTPAPGSAFGDLDLRLRVGSGVVDVRASAAVLADEPDEPRIVVVVARDVRDRLRLQEERRQLDEKIRQGQKLESLGVLAGGIAHDFNNLLVGILGNASLASLELAEHESARKLVERIERSAHRAADLTKQMLAYSGRGRFEVAPIQLPELVREISELIDASISKKTLLELDFEPNLPTVDGDPTQLRQVVMNLLMNASEAMGESGGDLLVQGRSRMLSSHEISELIVASESMRSGGYIELAVRDSGPGMDEETATRMFDPFFTTKSTGRGLGLAATLGIVRGHGGGLSVESEPGRGTTVSVYLPPGVGVVLAKSPDEEDTGVWASQGAILVADDEPEVLEFIEAVLTRRGFHVLCARDGVECVEIFEEFGSRISLVVLDMTMPRMNGEEALRAIRAMIPDIRVILSSGYDEQETIARFGDSRPAGFLQKPYRASQLTDLVKQLLGEG